LRFLHNTKNIKKEDEKEATKEHLAAIARYGGLYLQYEPEYWWFEMVVILQKMIMTGAMCVVAQISSVQLLIAIMVMLMYMLLVLKTAPFEADSEDWTAFVACVALTLTTLGGLVLIMDDPTTRTYESAVLAVILIGINVLCIATEILIVVFVGCGLGKRCQRCGRGGSGDEKTSNNSKVLPETKEKQRRIEAAADKAWE
jgi:hypothetical protein